MGEGSAPAHFDVIIVGAGISGIDAAYHLQRRLPDKTFIILEGREAIGGTWDLFRYPGIRSDSDMYTLGFPFRPWTGESAIAGGAAIRDYVEETARAFGIDRHIRFRHRAMSASWSTPDARWSVEAEASDERKLFTCGFLFLCSGYYDYESGYRPHWPDEDRFAGRIVHPQHWPNDLDVAGRSVVVIGSGATAVTLVPALAGKARQVTMLQRSPSYVVARPSRDRIALWLQKRLPARLAASAVRWKNLLLGMFFFNRARARPDRARRTILRLAARDLPPGYDVDRHFSPSYDPWDQRLCLAADADLFRAIASGKAQVVTDRIDRFETDGIRLGSGGKLDADVVVTATGLQLKMLGGMRLVVDGDPVDPATRFSYKGMMLNDVPNLALSFGYTNASWTLKCDLTSLYVCRLLRHMDRTNAAIGVPRLPPGGIDRRPMLEFTSGYIERARGLLPAQGSKPPWRLYQNYLKDLIALRFRPLADGMMQFEPRRADRTLTPLPGQGT